LESAKSIELAEQEAFRAIDTASETATPFDFPINPLTGENGTTAKSF
jgi:hypothetical protein